MSVDFNSGSYLLRDILVNTNTNETLTYAEKEGDKKEAALDYAKGIIKGIEKEYNKSHESIGRGTLNAAELGDLTKYEDELAELNLDDKEGLSKEELASYILAADGLARTMDEKYIGWDFLPDADIDEEDLRKTIFEEDNVNGNIDEGNMFALENYATRDLKATAQEIYDANFKKDNNNFVMALVKGLFLH